ncbi:4-hydroxyphenylacetate 3-hydroxylase [Reyranella aquatilis]|uniref:4-hydroxyphenylacetate 3-hydroxylase n=1 Tax=Reyranella aquatilis TaxID=2035356 RepID=A0ABS8KUS1_9HYPH|nr:4-hydroxyphenylacetate 3-hydroxylase N-terminal domain-containing protein [Reyranella aquatilis]MCC8429819.1 4-hydroxyphenylacetate 3-hydroxylase [Reyranella aquatilis]
MGARTGSQFLDGLRKTRREIWVDGEKIADVTAHPKLRGGAESLAAHFDRQHAWADECLFTHPDSGQPTSVSHMIPRSHDELRHRHAGLVRLSEGSMGIMGRTPDYMNMKFAAFASAPGVWAGADGRNAQGAKNLVAFQRRLAEQDLSLTHTIIQPTTDKRTDAKLLGNKVTVRKVGQTADGIIVRGGRVLATLAPYADEQTVYPGQPIPAGASEYAVSFAIPLDTPGLKFLCRDSAAAPGADPFDRPLSSRFDEQDAFCIFDDVLVPWDRVFIDGDVEIYNSMRQTGFTINMTTQSTVRALTKLEFAYGLATRMAELIGDHAPATMEMLGELACYVRMTANALELSLEQAAPREDGVWFPRGAPLEPLRAMLPVWMPRVAEIITLIGSHNLLTTPSRAQFDDPGLRPLIDEMLGGADGAAADDRAAVFRLAWDFVGSALAGRGFLYERFYLTSAARNKQMLHQRFFDRTRSQALVDDMLSRAR